MEFKGKKTPPDLTQSMQKSLPIQNKCRTKEGGRWKGAAVAWAQRTVKASIWMLTAVMAFAMKLPALPTTCCRLTWATSKSAQKWLEVNHQNQAQSITRERHRSHAPTLLFCLPPEFLTFHLFLFPETTRWISPRKTHSLHLQHPGRANSISTF